MQQIGGFQHLLEALDFAAQNDAPRLSWFDSHGQLLHQKSYRDVSHMAQSLARQLRLQLPMRHKPLQSSAPAHPPRIGIIASTGPEFLAVFCACQMIGAIPCPMPVLRPLQDAPQYCRILHKMCEAAGIEWVLGPKQVVQLLEQLGLTSQSPKYPVATHAFEDLAADCSTEAPIAHGSVYPPIHSASIAYIQFSSGSTGNPKGIAISHAALMHNIDAILQHGMQIQVTDRAFSWLPYYHDMGLVGFVLAPLCGQVHVDYLAPSSFVRRPYLWIETMAKRGSTITYAPDFAWTMAIETASKVSPTSQIKALRIAGVGGDYVHYATLHNFAACFAQHGFNPDAFKPSYGLAEATLAVSFCNLPLHEQSQYFVIHAGTGEVAAATPSHPQAKAMVSCGEPLPGWKVCIRNDTGQPIAAAVQGHICLQGPAQMSGIFHAGTLHPIPTNQFFDTGDTGFLTPDGALFVSGRSKDLMVIHGRNVWPIDIENTVTEQTGIALEHQIFLHTAMADDPQLRWRLLVHEKALAKSDQSRALRDIARVATAAAGVSVQAAIIPNGTIAYTSSGKKARSLTMMRINEAPDG